MTLQELMSKATDSFSAGRCFGPPIEKNGMMVIPVAIAGGGGGGGDATSDAGQPATGGGFGGMAWPLGVYVVKGDDVRWVPVVDPTRLALALIGLVKIGLKVRAVRRN
jgi:uncharacterized spore protein YtfJ